MTLTNLVDDITRIPEYRRGGQVVGMQGMLLEVGGAPRHRPHLNVLRDRLPRRPGAAHVVRVARRNQPGLHGPSVGLRSGDPSSSGLAGPRRQCHRGIYDQGSGSRIEAAIRHRRAIQALLAQRRNERVVLAGAYVPLAEILGMNA